jgi:hypothetical protein
MGPAVVDVLHGLVGDLRAIVPTVLRKAFPKDLQPLKPMGPLHPAFL